MGIMETISITSRDYSSPSGKLVTRQYEVMNLQDELLTGKDAEAFMKEHNIELDFANFDRFVNREEDSNAYKRPYMYLACVDNPQISAMQQNVDGSTRNVVKRFFDGTMTADELKENFKSLAYQSLENLA